MTIADKLKEQADRLNNIVNALENGALKASDIDITDIENLETLVSDYEQLLKRKLNDI